MSNRYRYDSAFRSAFELDSTYQLSDLRYQSIEDWDSIGHMALMSELEDAFDIIIKTEDLIQFESYIQGAEILTRYSIDLD